MSFIKKFSFFLFGFALSITPLAAGLSVGVGQSELTPPNGTPSAGYIDSDRKMEGTHDPLLATALVIHSNDKKIALCAVDHLGFDHKMVEEIKEKLPGIEVVVASSHTHSGAGAYLDLPVIGELLAGPFDQKIRQMLVTQTVKAIEEALGATQEAKIGIGYGKVQGLNTFRSSWPKERQPPENLAVIQFVSQEGETLATLFNFAMHPTALSAKNRYYSADFVGFARKKIQNELGGTALFFNGAQGDVGPKTLVDNDEFLNCQLLGEALADAVTTVTDSLSFQEECSVAFLHYAYAFDVKPTSTGMQLPLTTYNSELNILVFNHSDAFVTVPGELSCLYLDNLQEQSPFSHTSVLGLANDAHGYILPSEAFEHKTHESTLSFGGPEYGDWMVKQILSMLHSEELKK